MMLSHHLQHDPIVTRPGGVLRITDWDYGLRPIKAPCPQPRTADGRFARKH